MSDRFKDTTFICYHSVVSGVITECRLGYQQPTVIQGHEEGRERGGKEGGKAADECKAQERREWRRSSQCVLGERDQNPERRVALLLQIWDHLQQGFNQKNLFKIQSW